MIKKFCKRGHLKLLHGSGASCKPCQAITSAAWLEKNKEHRRASAQEWRIANSDRHRARSAKYYQENKGRILEKQRIYKERRGGAHRNHAWRRYGILNADGTPFVIDDYKKAFELQKGNCRGCGRNQSEFKNSLTADHDHATGFFRGLLCYRCNYILGLCKDNAETLSNLSLFVS